MWSDPCRVAIVGASFLGIIDSSPLMPFDDPPGDRQGGYTTRVDSTCTEFDRACV